MDSSTIACGSGFLFGHSSTYRLLPSAKSVPDMLSPIRTRAALGRLWSDTTAVAVLLLVCVLCIFALSHQSGSVSGIGWTPPLWYIVERKSAHVLEYFLTTLVALRFISLCFPNSKFLAHTLAAGLFILALAVSDEIHQLFVYARTAKLTDVGFDMLGYLIAVASYYSVSKQHNNKSL